VFLSLGPPAGAAITAPSVLQATISDNTSIMAVAKYTVDRLTLYLGYEWNQFAPPSDMFTNFTDISGDQICTGVCGTATGTKHQ
jgi:hypothetical protein